MNTSSLEIDVRAVFREVSATTLIPPVPTYAVSHSARWRRQRGPVAVLCGAAAFVFAGLGVAVATGAADGNLAFWGTGADASRAQIVGSFSVPGGLSVRVETAPMGDETCVSFRVLPQRLDRPPNEGGGCSGGDVSQFDQSGAGDEIRQYADSPVYVVFAVSAGSARTAVLDVGGHERDVLVAGGYVIGWAPDEPSAVVTGYDADGNIVGSFRPAIGTPSRPEATASESPAGVRPTR